MSWSEYMDETLRVKKVFITLDLVIRDNPKIEEAFNLYKRTVRSASVEPTAFDVKESEVGHSSGPSLTFFVHISLPFTLPESCFFRFLLFFCLY